MTLYHDFECECRACYNARSRRRADAFQADIWEMLADDAEADR